MKNYKGEIGLLIVAIIWGSGFVASDISLNYFTPIEAMAIRFFIGSVCLSIVFNKYFKKINKQVIKSGALLGIFLYSAFLLQTIGLSFTTPSKNAFLTSINVVIVPFIGFVIYKRKLDIYGLIGAILACIGIGIISLNSNLNINFGDFLTILCAIGFAFHIFFTGEFLKNGNDPILLTIVQIITSFFISVVVLLFVRVEKNISFSNTSLIATIYLGLLSTTVAFLLQTISQKHTSETKAAILLSTESVFGAFFSFLILKEEFTLKTLIGCSIIFMAIMISEIKPKFLILQKNRGL